MPSFLRRGWYRYSKLGKRRKNKQVWRRPTGRDNKMREKRRGYSDIVGIGHRTEKKLRNKIKGKIPIQINNLKDLEKLEKGNIAIIGKVGKKMKIELAKKASELKIDFVNMNSKSFLKKVNKKDKKNESK